MFWNLTFVFLIFTGILIHGNFCRGVNIQPHEQQYIAKLIESLEGGQEQTALSLIRRGRIRIVYQTRKIAFFLW